jgi:hypothetical protein
MWALLDYDNETVIGCFPPDIDIESIAVKKEIDGRKIVQMTIENSPAYVNGKYLDGKFYPPKEMKNG